MNVLTNKVVRSVMSQKQPSKSFWGGIVDPYIFGKLKICVFRKPVLPNIQMPIWWPFWISKWPPPKLRILHCSSSKWPRIMILKAYFILAMARNHIR